MVLGHPCGRIAGPQRGRDPQVENRLSKCPIKKKNKTDLIPSQRVKIIKYKPLESKKECQRSSSLHLCSSWFGLDKDPAHWKFYQIG